MRSTRAVTEHTRTIAEAEAAILQALDDMEALVASDTVLLRQLLARAENRGVVHHNALADKRRARATTRAKWKVKTKPGVGPGLPKYPQPAAAAVAVSAVGTVPTEATAMFKALQRFDGLSHAQLSLLAAAYNEDFGILGTDDVVARRAKLLVWLLVL